MEFLTHPVDTPASSKRPLAPDTRRLDERSARAWIEAMAVRPLGNGRYAVDSQSGATYVVDLPAGDCTCPDHVIRGERCKHIRRVAIEVTSRRVPPPGKIRATCRVCQRESFVPEGGPAVCAACGFERGDVVTDRETGDVLVVYRLTADRADERYIESAGCSVASYPGNDGYPPDDPVVEVVYPFSGGPHATLDERPHYAFPLSRLSPRERLAIEGV